MDISQLKKPHWLTTDGNHIAAFHKGLSIFSMDGQLVAAQNNPGHIHAVCFLPNGQLLVADSKQFSLLSLQDGTAVWRVPRPKYTSSYSVFRLSPTGDCAYWVDERRMSHFVIRIDLSTGKTTSFRIKNVLRATCDFFCDTEGALCFLQGQHTEFDDRTISENCILRAQPESDNLRYTVAHRWQSETKRGGHAFLGSADTVLTEDLWVYLPAEHTAYPLVENGANFPLPVGYPHSCGLDPSGRYEQFVYLGEKCSIVVDTRSRRIVAQYALPDDIPGCLVDNEYWVCSGQGLLRKPFPAWEERPPKKLTPMFTTPPDGAPI